MIHTNTLKTRLTLLLLASTLAQQTTQALAPHGAATMGSNRNSQHQGVRYFQGSWIEIQQIARQQKRPVFVEVYADNYAPSRHLSELLSDESVADYYNQHFLNYRVDINSLAGKQFIEQYHVAVATEMLFFDHSGCLVSRQAGATSSTQARSIASVALKQACVDLDMMQEQYNKGFRSPAFLFDFAYQMRQKKLPHNQIVDDYLQEEKLRKTKCTDIRDIRFVYDFAPNLQTAAMDVLLDNKEAFERTYGTADIDQKIKTAATVAAHYASTTHQPELLDRACQVVEKANIDDREALLFQMRWNYYEAAKDSKNQVKLLHQYMKDYGGYDHQIYHQRAVQLMYAAPNNAKETKLAQQWLERSVGLDANYYNLKDYARLLINIGKVDQAQQILRQALTIGRSRNIDCSEGQLLLESLSLPNANRIVRL